MAAVIGVVMNAIIENGEERQNRYQLRLQRRRLRDASNAFDLPENQFIKMFRLNKEAARYVINSLQNDLPINRRITSIPNHLKILCALHFFGYGSYQRSSGGNFVIPISQPTVSKIIKSVCDAIQRNLLRQWIKFPTTDNEINIIKNEFFRRYGFPNTLGVIDGTHVAIIAPPNNHAIYPGQVFYNRKGFYSINCQIIANAKYQILSMNARFPGSVHDSAVWISSRINHSLRGKYMQGQDNGYLIGDEGYPLLPWLMVPYPGIINENTPQGRFNQHLRRARLVIERTIGVLKGRFRCLLKHRTLNYDPLKAAKIIYSCAVMHNIALTFNREENLEDLYEDDIRNDDTQNAVQDNLFGQGERIRNQTVEQYFV